jgi:hypothetical protein
MQNIFRQQILLLAITIVNAILNDNTTAFEEERNYSWQNKINFLFSFTNYLKHTRKKKLRET